MKVGPKPNPVRALYVEKYGLSHKQASRLTPKFLEQLERCKSEEARRILIGVKRRNDDVQKG
jgi:hypothetical protein